VSQLVAKLFQMRAQMQKLMGMVQGQEAIAGMGDLKDSLKPEEKVTMSLVARRIFLENFVISELLCIVQAPPGTARRKRRNNTSKQRDLDAVLS
jgi:signal recognition particle subunit SRP54